MTEETEGHDITDSEAGADLQPDDSAADPVAVVLKMQREAETAGAKADDNHLHDTQVLVKDRLLDRMLEQSQERRARPSKPHLRIVK